MRWADYFGHAWRLLEHRGRLPRPRHVERPVATRPSGPSFLETYVWPDHDLVPVSTVLAAAEGAQFEVRDVESLREHYMLTSRRWLERLEVHREDGSGSRMRPSSAFGGSCSQRSAYRFARGTRTSTRPCSRSPTAE